MGQRLVHFSDRRMTALGKYSPILTSSLNTCPGLPTSFNSTLTRLGSSQGNGAKIGPLFRSEDDRTGEVFTDPDILAQYLSGTAHVVQLDSDSSWQLSREWGKDWSTFPIGG